MSPAILVDAIAIGAVYALVALGFTIIFAPTRVINFAQGEFVVLGAVVAFQLMGIWGWHPLAMIAGTLVLALIMSAVLERMIMLPVRLSGSHFAWILATLAASLIFQAVFGLRYPSALLKPQPMLTGSFSVGGVAISYQELIIVVGALVIMGAYDQFLKRTIYGRAIRAAAHNPDTATLMGIGVRSVVLISFLISGVVTAVAGMLAAPEIFIEPGFGLVFTIKGFVAIIIGGIGSARGALVGGLIVGLLDTIVRNAVSASIGNMVVVAVLAVIIVLFPSGLFGKPIEAH